MASSISACASAWAPASFFGSGANRYCASQNLGFVALSWRLR